MKLKTTELAGDLNVEIARKGRWYPGVPRDYMFFADDLPMMTSSKSAMIQLDLAIAFGAVAVTDDFDFSSSNDNDDLD